MPNHVTNRLTLHCDSVLAAEVFSEICGVPEDGAAKLIDFDKLIPYPKRFADADRKRNEWEKANPRAGSPNAPDDGYNRGGYEWCIKNWGTKWNAYGQKRLSKTSIRFDTAWNTPEPIFAVLSAKYPSLSFSVEYADEDIGRNAGKLHYRDSQKGEAKLAGAEAAKLYFNLNPGDDPKDYDYDPATFEYVGEDDA